MSPAPTLAPPSNPQSVAGQNANAPVPLIPFTRASRKKSRLVGQLGPIVIGAGLQQLNPVQIPANGFIRKLILDVTCTTAGNSAAVAFQNDAPYNILQQISLAAANGDSLINPVDGFTLAMINKYGAFSSQVRDPLFDPTFTKVTGSGATGGSFHFQLEIPFEFDARDACGALPNMAANQSFLLQAFLNTSAQIYSTPPTAAGSVVVNITAEYWAAPDAANAAGVPQQQSPRCNNLVSLIQTQNPVVVPSTDQVIQLQNVGNTVRWIMFILRTAAGVRTEADWPAVFNILVNNDLWLYKTKNNWRRQMAYDYDLVSGAAAAATPTVSTLDAGVYILTDFMNDGSPGDGQVSGASNRDLMLPTTSGTALNIEAQNWGAAAGQLLVVTNSLRIPDPASFYAPLGI